MKATYDNTNRNDWYLSKCERMLQSVYGTTINQFLRFVQLATRFENFYCLSFDMMISAIDC